MKSKCAKLILKNIFHVIAILFFILVALDATQNYDVNFSDEKNLASLTEILTVTNFN